jgi:hypothetical protein
VSDGWQDLPDLQAVSKAQAEGWEIEILTLYGAWMKWGGKVWDFCKEYRGRPAQPKTKVVTSECWRHKTNGQLAWREPYSDEHFISEWQRFPCGDRTGEVCDD